MMRVLGYTRVSTAEQAGDGYGLGAQASLIGGECSRRGWRLVETVREGLSASSLDRPVLQQSLARVAAGEAEGLVVAKLDRLTRSVIDLGLLLEWFDRAGASLVALDLGVDTSTPQGELVANVLGAVARWERRIIGARTRDGLAQARREGRPVGRGSVRDRPGVVGMIEALASEGLGATAIARELDARGVPTLRGAAGWRQSTVRGVLNPDRPRPVSKPVPLPAIPR